MNMKYTYDIGNKLLNLVPREPPRLLPSRVLISQFGLLVVLCVPWPKILILKMVANCAREGLGLDILTIYLYAVQSKVWAQET